MGAWGTGIFENDDVLDWKAELLDSEGLEMIAETLETVMDEEYIEVDLASNTLGAIEILAALQGKPGEELKRDSGEVEELKEWIEQHQGQGKSLLPLAKKAIKKIKKDSELKELWEESEDHEAWLHVIKDLESRL
ncbi:DUF4259 domain-containing protein [Paenibacillus lignilyticus]|uniref:DUF4259 domain-containing protein n=1 Tax=Paenibacillus lignilyticus TaxID=1172615 RepID=A0ABS5CI05_9BACL|nr:DUF4259 domain-containing protein [Paenibacillus lignilyticus]MBP3965508.1 DUF4259 domain-containing protein [Paenibacillus lignilyticus]